jgi:hypothetical protein
MATQRLSLIRLPAPSLDGRRVSSSNALLPFSHREKVAEGRMREITSGCTQHGNAAHFPHLPAGTFSALHSLRSPAGEGFHAEH